MKTYEIDDRKVALLATKLAMNENGVPKSAIRVKRTVIEVEDNYSAAFETSIKQAGRLLKQKDEPEGEVDAN